jgi:hypothetical protein
MSTTFTTKPLPQVSSGFKSEVVVIFYLLTFLTGAFFLFVGGRLGFVIELTAAVLYIAATVLFYTLSTREPTQGGKNMGLTNVR